VGDDDNSVVKIMTMARPFGNLFIIDDLIAETPFFLVKSSGRLMVGNLVDPASSHMLVLKIKPCMSKYNPFGENCGWLIKSVGIYMNTPSTWITTENLRLIHAQRNGL
jgi:hypothetical protein